MKRLAAGYLFGGLAVIRRRAVGVKRLAAGYLFGVGVKRLAAGYLFGGLAVILCMALHCTLWGTLFGILVGTLIIQIGSNR